MEERWASEQLIYEYGESFLLWAQIIYLCVSESIVLWLVSATTFDAVGA